MPDTISEVVTIDHNPNCGTSRNTLALIRNASIEPTVIEYLQTPPSGTTLVAPITAMGVPVRAYCERRARPTRISVSTIQSGLTTSWST